MNKYILPILLNILLSMLSHIACIAEVNPSFQMSYFEDVNSTYDLNSIKNESFQWVPSQIINLGMTKSTVWIKLELNRDILNESSVLEVKNAFCDSIQLSYYINENVLINDTLGIVFPQSKNKLKHYLPAFNLPILKLSSSTVYLKIKSRWSMVLHLDVRTKNEFNNGRITTYLIGGLLLGGLILMAIYNLFLYFSTRDFSYLIYVLALISAILSQGYIFGILIPYLSPESPEFSLRFPIVIMAFTGLCSCWFAIRFLEIKHTSKVFYNLLVFGILFSFFSAGLELLHFDELSRKVNIIEVVGLSCIIFSAALYSLIKGNKIALYFTIAWFFYLSGMVVFALKTIDILPHNMFTKHFMHVGTFMEVVLLSFALGHKYSLVRVQKEQLEQQTKEELEELVKLQTVELEASLEEKEILLKEIHHRVKNNLQIVISLLDLQVASVKDSRNKEILAQSKSRVYSMSLIHQKLYQSNNLAKINVKTYLEDLFIYVLRSYENINGSIVTEVNIDTKELSITKAVPMGLIVNELLTNSFKYGITRDDNNKIKMTLEVHGEMIILEIADTGYGFDEKNNKQDVKKSLGLFLVKSLTKQLRGQVIREFRQGYFVTQLSFSTKDKIV